MSDGPATVAAGSDDADGSGGAGVVLLAVDVGLYMGLAQYDVLGRLRHCASRHVANRTVLKRLAADTLRRLPELTCLALEGGGPLAEVWAGLAGRRGIQVLRTTAEEWRRDLLLCREQRSGPTAKQHALRLAEAVRRHFGTKRTASLRDDAAEAVLLGLWACHRIGLPADLSALRH